MPPKTPLNWGLLPPSFLLPTSTRSLLSQIPAVAAAPQPAYTTVRTVMKFKSTQDPKPSRFTYVHGRPALESTKTAALARKAPTTPLRTGLLGTKKGMTAIYDPETGKREACTILQIDRNEVIAHKTRDKNGYWAVQIGAGHKEPGNVTRPMLGHFAVARVSPKRWVKEFKVLDKNGLQVEVGQQLGPSWFTPGQYVDVRGDSHGKGFAGGMKKHGWGGQPASHGQSLMHRGMGSAGGSQGSGSRVIPGKKMPGRMGGERVTVKNLKVLQVDEANGILVVNGAVPGPRGQIISVQDAINKPWPAGPMSLAEIKPVAETPTEAAVAA